MEPDRIEKEDVKRRLDAGEPVVWLDARADDAANSADTQIPGSLRVAPDRVEQHVNEIPSEGLVVAYCTSPEESTSARVAEALRDRGRTNVKTLTGGFEGWRAAGYPVERKAREAETASEVAENLRQAEGDQDLPM